MSMTDTLAFLDACGRDPALLDDLATRVATLDLPDAEADALLARDPARIAALLGADQTMMCLVMEPQRENEPQPEKAPDDAPGDDDPEQR